MTDSPNDSRRSTRDAAPAACAFLKREGRSALLGYFRKRANRADAEDLAHDAFLKAWTKCRDLDSPDRVRPWLFSLARNHLVDHYRAASRPTPIDDPAYPQSPDNAAACSDAFREDIVAMLRERLHLLPLEQQPIVESLLAGHRQVDIARRLQLPLSTVKTRAQRARRRILEYAEQQCDFSRDAFGRVIDCQAKDPKCCADAQPERIASQRQP